MTTARKIAGYVLAVAIAVTALFLAPFAVGLLIMMGWVGR
jgi:hypothetical protein